MFNKKSSHRKLYGILAAIVAMCCLMTACGGAASTAVASTATSTAAASTPAEQGNPTDLTLWLPPFASGDTDSLDKDFWTTTLAPWAEEKNVNLNIEITPWSSYEEKYLTAFSAGTGPDVGYMYMEMFSDFIDMGALADVDEYFTQEEKDNYLYYTKGNMKGGQYAIPFVVGGARVMMFNMDILEKAGVTELPTTWEDFEAVLQKIKDSNQDGVIPFLQGWADSQYSALNNFYYPYLWQAGGDLYNADGTCALLDNDAAVEAAQWLLDLQAKGLMGDNGENVSMKGSEAEEAFTSGKVGALVMSTGWGNDLTAAGLNWDFVPCLEKEQKAIWVASDSLIVNAASENKELACDLVKYITSADVMAKFHKEIAAYPPITKDESYNDNPAFEEMYTSQTESFHTLPVANGSFKMIDTLYKNMQLMMAGDLTPEEALQQTVDYAKSLS